MGLNEVYCFQNTNPWCIAVAFFRFPRWFGLLLVAHFLAGLAHFSHNAQYLSFYPGMPAWLTPERVYLAWWGLTAVGGVALCLCWWSWHGSALLGFAVYGALGLDGLMHYKLGLCADHTWVANLTIWAESLTGAVVLVAAVVLAPRYLGPHQRMGGVP